jgi:hypothetical protein
MDESEPPCTGCFTTVNKKYMHQYRRIDRINILCILSLSV